MIDRRGVLLGSVAVSFLPLGRAWGQETAVFPKLSRIGLVPPEGAVEGAPFGTFGMFTCGDYGWGDWVSLAMLDDFDSGKLDGGDMGKANARPFDDVPAPVETVERDGISFLVSSAEIPDYGAYDGVITAKIDGRWIQATVLKQAGGPCTIDQLLAAGQTMQLRPALTNAEFNEEAPIRIDDFAGFDFAGLANGTLTFRDLSWVEGSGQGFLMLLSEGSESTARTADSYKLGSTGVEDMFMPFDEGTMTVIRSEVVERDNGRWYDFEATGTTYAGERYVVMTERFFPLPKTLYLTLEAPVAEKDALSARLWQLRDSIRFD